MSRVVVITGLSGAGRSVAGGALEDLGWFVIDNLPAGLVSKVGELASSTGDYEQVALAMAGFSESLTEIEALRSEVSALTVVFLEASTDVLVRRYELTRRRHPLADDGTTVVDAIERERALLAPTRTAADLVVDTTELNPHQLRERITGYFADDAAGDQSLRLLVSSFGYKHGLPIDADLVVDCRFLPNPNWVDELRPLSGLDSPVQAYVGEREVTAGFLERLLALLDTLLPAYAEEGKSYLSIAFGCTGGRHRSVAVTEAVAERLAERGWRPRVSHRDINRD